MTALRYLRVGFALAAAVTVAAACSAFSDAEEETPAPTPDASPDSSQSDGTTTGSDATADAADAADATSSCTVFADDFNAGNAGKWELLTANCTNPTIGFESEDAGDNSVVLGCNATMPEAYHVLAKGPFPSVAKTRVSFSFEIGTTDSHVFAQLLHLFGAFGENLSFVATPSTIELWNRKAGAMLTSWPANQKTWHSIVVDLEPKDPQGATIAVKAELDSASRSFEVSRGVDGGEAAFQLQLGVYANVGIADFVDAYDDISVSSCP